MTEVAMERDVQLVSKCDNIIDFLSIEALQEKNN